MGVAQDTMATLLTDILAKLHLDGPQLRNDLDAFIRTGYPMYAGLCAMRIPDDATDMIREIIDLKAVDLALRHHCLTKCAEMWQKLADHTEMEKEEACGADNIPCHCWACYYDTIAGECDCRNCIIIWSSLDAGCMCIESPYRKWVNADSPELESLYASQVVKLCKEALDAMV